MSKLCIVRKEGGSRVLALTKVIPESWTAVEVELLKKHNGYVTIKIIKVK